MMNKLNNQKLATPIKYSEWRSFDSPSYEEQFFQINLDNLTLPDKPTIKDVLITEWNRLTLVNDFPYDYRDPTGLLKPQKRKAQLDDHLFSFLENPKNSKKNFLYHFQHMCENHSKYIDQNDEVILKEWLTEHIILLDHAKKSKLNANQYSGITNQTRAYIIHFRVRMGEIPADKVENNTKAIVHGTYLEHGDKQSYQEYRKIIKDNVQPNVIVESCRAILEMDDLDPAIKSQAKALLPR